MKIERLTVGFSVKLSRNYQSIEVTRAMEFTLEPSEDKKTAMEQAHLLTRRAAVKEAIEAIDEITGNGVARTNEGGR